MDHVSICRNGIECNFKQFLISWSSWTKLDSDRPTVCKLLTMSMEFDKNSSKWSYYLTDHKNYIKNFFEHFPSKLLDPQKSTFSDVILGIKLFF